MTAIGISFYKFTVIIGLLLSSVSAFHRFPAAVSRVHRQKNGVKSLSAVMDILASVSIAAQLNSAPVPPQSSLFTSSMNVAVKETVQGLYKEYTVDIPDNRAVDIDKRTYKTAEETDDSKNKYWTILAVLLAGSFIIPMVQYYWYVAEED